MTNIFVDASNPTSGTGTALDPYQTLGQAVADAGFRPLSDPISVFVADGVYVENVVISTRGNINFIATNGPTGAVIAPSSGVAFALSGDLNDPNPSVTADVTIDGFGITGGSVAVSVASNTILDVLTINNVLISDTSQHGVIINDVPGLNAVSITNSTFTDAGSGNGNSNGSGAIVLFDFHGAATISNVDIVSTDTDLTPNANRADTAIQISGFDQATYDVLDPIGTVSISDVDITGAFHKPPIMIQGFTNLTGLTFSNVTIDATTGYAGGDFGALVFIDPIGSSGQDTQGNGGYPGYFAGNAPGATNTLDLSGITIVNNGNPAATYDVVVRGTDADDIYTGTNGRDLLNAPAEGNVDYGGDDELHGAGGDDILVGGSGNDTLDGGADNDTAVYGGGVADFTIGVTTNPTTGFVTGFTSVTDNNAGDGDEGTDTLTDVEMLVFGDATLDLADPVQLFDGGGNIVGTFSLIQDAIDAAQDGYTINIAPGTYTEDLVINRAVTIVGAHAGDAVAGRDASGGTGETTIIGTHDITAVGDVTIDGIRFVNDGNVGASSSNPLVHVFTGGSTSGHTITNSIFWSDVAGASVDARAIQVSPVASGTVVISDNLISGASEALFSTASWGRGIWIDGGGVAIEISGNVIEWSRTALNLDASPPSTISVIDNVLQNAGSGASVGFTEDNITASGNEFFNVGTDFNFRNLTEDVDFDASGTVTVTPGAGLNDIVVILGGSGNDALTGTAGADYIDANNHPTLGATADADVLTGLGGDDLLLGRNGTDTAVYSQAIDVSMLSYNGTEWTVTTGGAEGTDTLTGVEIVESSSGRILLVGSGAFATIQDAVAAAQAGDTILVADGNYSGIVNISVANLTLIGANAGIAGTDARGLESTLTGRINVFADGVTVDGFAIAEGDTGLGQLAGVYVQANNATVTNNVITRSGAVDGDTSRGVLTAIGSGTGTEISNNAFSGWATGTYINPGAENTSIDGNSFEGNFVGMSIDGVADGTTVTSNEFINNIFESIGIGALDQTEDVSGVVAPSNTFTGAAPTVSIYPLSGVEGQDITGSDFADVFNGDQTDTALGQTFSGGEGGDTINGGGGADTLNGEAGEDTIQGGAGNDMIDGGLGADFMFGGADDDVYVVDDSGDAAIEFSNQGTDRVDSSVTYTLLANLENLTLTGTADLDGTGNALDNVIFGNSGANVLSGRNGADTISGGAGDDTIIGGAGGDDLDGGDDIDTLSYAGSGAGVTVNLGTGAASGGDAAGDTIANFENLVGSSLDDTLTGSAGANQVGGGAGNDSIQASGGFDAIDGGADIDTFDLSTSTGVVSNWVNLDAAGSQFRVDSGAGFVGRATLANIENVSDSAGNDFFYGNAGDNTYYYSAGFDTFDGNGGIDTLDVSAMTANLVWINLTAPSSQLRSNDGSGWVANAVLSDVERFVTTAQTDYFYGDATDSTYVYVGGRDFVSAGAGSDTLDMSGFDLGTWVNLNIAFDQFRFHNGVGYVSGGNMTGVENVIGSDGNDYFYADANNNTYYGGLGNDRFEGGLGDDTFLLDGTLGDYTVAQSGANYVVNGISGTDTLVGVEFVTLGGTTYDIATLDGLI